jgi:hypothetical protein
VFSVGIMATDVSPEAVALVSPEPDASRWSVERPLS